MGTPLTSLTPASTFDTLLKTNLEGPLTTTLTQIGDGAGNDSPLYLATDKIGFNEAVDMTKTSTEINSTVDKAAFITVTQAVDLDTIETNSNASKVKTDFITVTQAVDLDAIETNSNASKTKTDFITVTQAVDLDTIETNSNASKVKTDFITVTQNVDLDTIETNSNASKVITDFITVTQAVNLDTIESDTATNNAKVSNATHTGDVTGATALTIAAGAVTIAKLAATGTPSASTYLRGDNTWATISGSGDALTSNPLSQFAATTSAQLRGVMSDETGTGVLVFADAPTFVTGITTPAITLSGAISAATWGTSGIRILGVASTFTDTSASGTVATGYSNSYGGNTIAATNATRTFTNYVTSWFAEPVAGTNVVFTNKYAIGADSCRFGTSTQLTISNTGAITNNTAGAVSTSSELFTGTAYAAGTATTNKPLVLIEPTGTTSTGWSTLGTYLGINAPTGFTGRVASFQILTVEKFGVDTNGIYSNQFNADKSITGGAMQFTTNDNLAFKFGSSNTTSWNMTSGLFQSVTNLGAYITRGAGSQSTPTYAFAGPGYLTGMYAPTATSLAFSANGTLALTIGSTQDSTFAGTIITAAGTTTKAGLRLTAGVAPTTPVNGDMWQDGTNFKIQIGGVTKTVTLT